MSMCAWQWIVQEMRSPRVEDRVWAAWIAPASGPVGAMRIAGVLGDPAEPVEVRAWAAIALGRFGEALPREAKAVLERAQDDPDEVLRAVADRALNATRPD